jgi:hypothetical protein
MRLRDNMTRTALGTIIGLALGLALAFGGFGSMLVVALLGAAGFIVAKALDGDIDLSRYISGQRGRR